jgi:DNA-binding response OmpR family regulator
VRLLIVEDEPSLAATLEESLRAQEFETYVASDARSAWEVAWARPFDLVLLDVMLPEGDEAGFEWAREFRESGFHQPILFLTAREALPDRVRGLEVGDDYLAKPFALSELVARLKALHRRGEVRARQVVWGDVCLLVEERQVRLHGSPVRLTAKEYEVAELMMLNPGRVFTREEVLERIWGLGYDTPSNLVDVYVKNLRRKLADGLIETVRGVGYRFPG